VIIARCGAAEVYCFYPLGNKHLLNFVTGRLVQEKENRTLRELSMASRFHI